MKRNVIVLLSVAVLVMIAFYQNFSASSKQAVLPKETAPKINYLAPSFTLTGMDGENYKVGGNRDKPVLINFWASWCDPCKIEAPDLVHNAEKYGDRFDTIAVNVTVLDQLQNAKDFVKKYGYTFPVLMDTEGKVSDLYKVDGYPTSFLIDTNGVIRDVIYGIKAPKELEQRVLKLING